MRFRALPLLALVIALYGPPVDAHLACNSFEMIRARLMAPPWGETEQSSWVVEDLIYRHYRNDLTGTFTVLVTFEMRPGLTGACIISTGVGMKEQDL